MVRHALHLRQHAAQHGGAGRDGAAGGRLRRHGEGPAMRHRIHPRQARGEAGGATRRLAADQPQRALVGIAEPRLQPRHALAQQVQAQMCGFRDPGAHGAEGELVQPLALRRRAEFRLRRRGRPAHRHGGKRPVEEPAAVIQPGARSGRP